LSGVVADVDNGASPFCRAEADMTLRDDDEIAFAGNRDVVERELTRSVAQVLLLVPGKAAGQRSLQEVGVEIVLSVAFVRADSGPASEISRESR
jgi:hypothetical protein